MADRRTEGLYGKFIVNRTDGRDAVGEKHHGCTYFVLDLQHDKHMPAALRAYALSCDAEYPALARDLRQVAADFNSRAEFAGITAQKPALDLERQQLAGTADPSGYNCLIISAPDDEPCRVVMPKDRTNWCANCKAADPVASTPPPNEVAKMQRRVWNYINSDFDDDYSYSVDIMEDFLKMLGSKLPHKESDLVAVETPAQQETKR